MGRVGSIGGPGTRASVVVVERWESAEDISFDRDRVDIRTKCAGKLAKLAEWVSRNPLAIVALDAHTDQQSAFTGEKDPRLANRRLLTVRGALVMAGIAPERIFTGPFGERRLLCRETTAECLEANRRVEVLIGTPKVTAAAR